MDFCRAICARRRRPHLEVDDEHGREAPEARLQLRLAVRLRLGAVRLGDVLLVRVRVETALKRERLVVELAVRLHARVLRMHLRAF